jgi:hypothetical protein
LKYLLSFSVHHFFVARFFDLLFCFPWLPSTIVKGIFWRQIIIDSNAKWSLAYADNTLGNGMLILQLANNR